jgi:hypothetical protein
VLHGIIILQNDLPELCRAPRRSVFCRKASVRESCNEKNTRAQPARNMAATRPTSSGGERRQVSGELKRVENVRFCALIRRTLFK